MSHALPLPVQKAAQGRSVYIIAPEGAGTFSITVCRSSGLPEAIPGLSKGEAFRRARSLKGFLGYCEAAL